MQLRGAEGDSKVNYEENNDGRKKSIAYSEAPKLLDEVSGVATIIEHKNTDIVCYNNCVYK